MKNSLIIFFLFSALALHSQDKDPKVRYGLKFGFAYASLGPDHTDSNNIRYEYAPKFIITGGFRIQTSLGRNGLFMPELNFVDKSSNKKRTDQYYSFSYQYSSIFMELNLNLLKKFGTKERFLFLGGGPSFSLNTDNYSSMNKTDAGINLLAGYQSPIGFSAELSFNKGFGKHSDNLEYYTPGQKSVSASCIAFSVGYIF